jgi:hypothetical protein
MIAINDITIQLSEEEIEDVVRLEELEAVGGGNGIQPPQAELDLTVL